MIALATTAVAALSGGGTAGASAMHHGFRQTNLVSDIPGRAQLTDPNLVNPWGLAAGPTTPLWVADNGTGLATLYAGGTGGAPFSIAPLVFTVPMGAPTGQVFNASNGFKLRTNVGPMPAKFIFDSEAGVISAWTLTNPIQPNVRTKLVVPGAIFKGLAIGFFRHHPALYAADFGHSRVWVVDSRFHVMNTPGAFMDPTLPSDYSPFGIQSIGRWVVVSYAKHEPGAGRRDRRPRPRLRRRLHAERPHGRPPRQPRRAERALGPGAGTGATSAASAVRCWSATSATAASTRTTSRPASGWAICAGPTATRSPSTASGACDSATAWPVDPTTCCSAPASSDEAHGLLGMIRHVS